MHRGIGHGLAMLAPVRRDLMLMRRWTLKHCGSQHAKRHDNIHVIGPVHQNRAQSISKAHSHSVNHSFLTDSHAASWSKAS